MRVISLKLLRDFWRRFPDAERPLRQWYKRRRRLGGTDLHDTRRTYPHADAVRVVGETLTVFNIGGNKYRLIARLRYDFQLVNVRAVLTHREYTGGDWRK